MNSKVIILAVLSIPIVYSCSSPEVNKKKSDKAFFPVNAQIISELKQLDSLPLAIFRYKTTEGHTDTTIITKAEFRDAVQTILDADITGEKFQDMYTESVYMDQSINSITMTYIPVDEKSPVRKVDVYLDPENDRMKQVYVESIGAASGDSTVLRKMLWAPGHYFQVTSLLGTKGNTSRVFMDKYSWESAH
jgi:hypothetical protein